MDPLSLGQLCLERRLLTEEQLKEYLEIQRQGEEWRHLGQVLLVHGVLTGVTLANLLSYQARGRGKLPGAPPAAAKRMTGREGGTELDWLLSEARDKGALGLLLDAGHPPILRLRGGARPLEGPPVKEQQLRRMLAEAVPQSLLDRVEAHGSAAATLEFGGWENVRVAVYRHRDGIAVSLKSTVPHPRPIEELGLPAGARDLIRHRSGLALVTGPSGSGRSTTMISLLDAINRTRPCHILAIESPPELRLSEGKAQITRRDVDTSSADAAAMLRSAPGSDADVVYIAELGTRGAIAAALDLAQSGHLVLAGMRTPGVQASVGRIVDTFRYRSVPFAEHALANCLRGILSQRLFAPRRDDPAVVAAELLLPTPGVVETIREGRIGQLETAMQSAEPDGLVRLEESLARLVKRGRIRIADAVAAANDPAALRRLVDLQGETARAGA